MSGKTFIGKQPLPATLLNELSKCTRCHLCSFVCPVYQAKQEEQVSPRGIIGMIRNSDGSDNLHNITGQCLETCHETALCANECPTGVDFIQIVKYFSDGK